MRKQIALLWLLNENVFFVICHMYGFQFGFQLKVRIMNFNLKNN